MGDGFSVPKIFTGGIEIGAFYWCEFCEVRIPCKDELLHEGESEIFINIRQEIIETKHLLLICSHVISS